MPTLTQPARSPFAPDLLNGEVALVTGGSAGLGLAIATGFAAHGARVVVLGRSPDRLDAATDVIGRESAHPCAGIRCDVRDPAAIEAAREQVIADFGAPTILVNNAAANFEMAAERMTGRAFGTVLDIDLVGTFNVTRAFVSDMIGQTRGTVLNVVVPDAERGFPRYSHAGAAKAGIISLTRSWAREWGPHGIRVNALGPGPVPTEGVARNMLGMADAAGAFGGLVGRIPLGRLGTPEDIALACTFLCSRAASWVTGVSLTVDGGLSLP